MSKFVLDRIKREVIIETNKIRTNPKSYIPILEKYLQNFDGNVLTKPEKQECLETQEGPKAYKEAIEFLKNQKPIEELEYDEVVSQVADEYVKLLGIPGKVEQAEDELKIEERVGKYLEWDYAVSESIDYGGATGEEVIINLLVDDGVQFRTHRENLFNTKYGYYGVAVGPHPEYDYCTVIDYFGDIIGYKDKEKNKQFQEKKAKKFRSSGNKMHFGLNKKGMPNKKFPSLTHQNDSSKKVKVDIGQENLSIKSADKKSVSEYEEYDEINNNENPFYDDPDAPEGCIKRKVKFHKKKFPKKTLITTVKLYLLEDGSEESVTIDEVIFDD